jgi:hypothetical protein
MRQTIAGVAAAIAVMTVSAVPAMACGGLYPGYGGPCVQSYVPTQYDHGGCYNGCGGWTYPRLPDPVQQYHSVSPVQQYYYVNRARPIAAPALSRLIRPIRKARYPAGTPIVIARIIMAIASARCAATTDRRRDPRNWRPFASCERALLLSHI